MTWFDKLRCKLGSHPTKNVHTHFRGVQVVEERCKVCDKLIFTWMCIKAPYWEPFSYTRVRDHLNQKKRLEKLAIEIRQLALDLRDTHQRHKNNQSDSSIR